NPVLYGLWSYADLVRSATLNTIGWHRAYCLAIALAFLALAHVLFPRKAAAGLLGGSAVSGRAWSFAIIIGSLTVATLSAFALWNS
ncbi:MAG TPA: hypothetical protein VGW32_04185, partial [Pyrinomonadaceae bacterium]|nr:hypothetical protein [Pyrinomonadaceae bacterium]